MNKKIRNQNQGFTIIEVLIVLAIAGLIMLIVFLAVPALQRQSRNTGRQNDIGRIGAAVTEYSSARNGSLPASGNKNDLMSLVGTLSQYDEADIDIGGSTNPIADINKVRVVTGHSCDGDSGAVAPGSSRQVAIQYAVETSGTPLSACQDV